MIAVHAEIAAIIKMPQHGWIVKLHSDLRILTQLQLVGVGVDFVFPLEGRKEEGRKEGRNPHLHFSRRNDPSCLTQDKSSQER